MAAKKKAKGAPFMQDLRRDYERAVRLFIQPFMTIPGIEIRNNFGSNLEIKTREIHPGEPVPVGVGAELKDYRFSISVDFGVNEHGYAVFSNGQYDYRRLEYRRKEEAGEDISEDDRERMRMLHEVTRGIIGKNSRLQAHFHDDPSLAYAVRITGRFSQKNIEDVSLFLKTIDNLADMLFGKMYI
ncbi:hypothetical protein GF371_00855 [Candidatus Woesearchaeota archaeon]|nr:hypothetical protein [Candidatus Woesearchaeota archaeon]